MNDSDQLLLFPGDPRSGLAHVAGRWVHFVYSSCLRQLGDAMPAELATATTFFLLARHLPRLAKRRYLLPWLFTTARRVCRRMLAAGPRASAGDDLAIGGYSAPADWAHVAEHLDEGLGSLPGDARDAILLKYLANLPISEVAQSLNISKQQAGQRISAGVFRLRRFYESRNHFMAPDAMIALIQAKAVAPAPANAIQVVSATLLDRPDPRVLVLADEVDKQRTRERIIAFGAAGLAFVIALAGGFRAVTWLANRPAPATQPVVVIAPPLPATRSQIADPPAVIKTPDTPWPKTRPVREVDPVFAQRLVSAIRRGDGEAMVAVVSKDEGLVNARDPATGKPVVEIAAELVDWRKPEAARIAHWLIDNGAVTSIHTAARAGHSQQVLRLLLWDTRLLNATDGQGLTPLQKALLNPGVAPECEQVAENLLAARANVDIWSAATLCRAEDVARLLAADATLADRRCGGATPLHWAVRPRRHGEDAMTIVKFLLDQGADPRTADASMDGMTALHHAAEWGDQTEMVKLLLDRGVDVNIPDDWGWTPLDYARDRARAAVMELLASRGGKRTTIDFPDQPVKTPRFLASVLAADAEKVKILLDDTPDLAKSRGPTGETPLHHAAALGSTQIIDLLLADKADINAQESNRFGGTPIHWAVKSDQLAAVLHLLAKGADPKQMNQRTGQNLLHVAARYTDNPQMIDLLLSKGVDCGAKDRWGRTPADWAKLAGHRAVEGKFAGAAR